MFITSLTTPTPSQPVVRSVGRLNITLEWSSGSGSSVISQFLPAVQDTTAFDFRIDVCAIANDRLLQLSSFSSSTSSSSSSTDDENIIALGNKDSRRNNNKDIRIADLTNILREDNNINKLTTATSTAKTVTIVSNTDNANDSDSTNNIPINTVCRNITILRPSINLDTTSQPLITTDKLIEYTQQSIGNRNSNSSSKRSRFKVMNEDNNSITTFSVVLGNEVNIQPNSMYVTRVTTVYNEYNSTPSHWSPLILTQPLTVPSHFPTLEFIREKVAIAFQWQKERYHTDHMTAVKRKAEEEGVDINAVKIMKKRLPRPLFVNCFVEASHIYTDGLGSNNNINNNNNNNNNVGILGTSIYLSFLKPIDDGGLNILGYQVYGRPVSCSDALTAGSRFSGSSGGSVGNNKKDIDLLCGLSSSSSSSSTTTATTATASHKKLVEHLPKTWMQYDASSVIIPSATVTATTVSSLYKARNNIAEQMPASSLDVVTIQVNNLHLDTFYEFKACAFNSLGCGPYSQYSNIFKTHSHNSGSGSGGGQEDGRRVNIILGQNYSLSLPSLSSSTTSPSVTSISAQAPSQQQTQQLLNNKWMIVNMNDQSLSLLDTTILTSTISLKQLQKSQNMQQIRIELMKAGLHRIDGWKCHWSSVSLATVAPLTIVGEVTIPTANIIYSTSSSSITYIDATGADFKKINADISISNTLLNDKTGNNDAIGNNNHNNNNSTLFGKIAAVQRGGVPIVHKVHAAQRAGAVGVVIVDNGNCKKFDQACMPGSDKSQDLGFAAHDIQQPWSFVRVPVLFILASDFQTLMNQSGLHEVLLVAGSDNENNRHMDTASTAAQLLKGSDEL